MSHNTLKGGTLHENIAVQKGLTQIVNHLANAGYRVYEFDTRQKASKDFWMDLMRWLCDGHE